MGDHLATIDMGRKVRAAGPFLAHSVHLVVQHATEADAIIRDCLQWVQEKKWASYLSGAQNSIEYSKGL